MSIVDAAKLAAVDRYLSDRRRALRLPGVAVVVVADRRIMYVRGYGTTGRGGAVTEYTPFILGSLSKAFTAFAVMQLVAQGEMVLDAPVQTYLPWFVVADERGGLITVRHLLSHASGFSRRLGRDLLACDRDRGLESIVRSLRSVHLRHAPGVEYEYSNINYVVLALLVERVSGLSYASYIRERVFSQIGMGHSYVSEQEAMCDGLSSGYRWFFGWPVRSSAPYLLDAQAAAFLVSSAADMGKWLLLQLGVEEAIFGLAGVSPEGLAEMHRPVLPTGKGTWAALGWRVGELADERVLLHGGEVSNYRSDAVLVPERGIGVVVLANANNGAVAQLGLDQLGQNVARLLLDSPVKSPRLPLPVFGALSGSAVALGLLIQIVLWLRLRRSSGRLTFLGVLSCLVDLGVPIFAFWRFPRAFDMSWRGLLRYVPDLSGGVLLLCLLSLLRGVVRLLRCVR